MKEQLDKIMNDWVESEMESAPEMRPTQKMYRMVQERRYKKSQLSRYARWVLVSAAFVNIVLIIGIYIYFLRQPGQEEPAGLWVRKGAPSEKRIDVKNPHMRRGPKKGLVFFKQLMFQYQKDGSKIVEAINLDLPYNQDFSLNVDDNYRIVLHALKDHHVYVYLLDSEENLIKLFPNSLFNPARNPVKASKIYEIPSSPEWFYIKENAGKARIYVISSFEPINELNNLYSQYRNSQPTDKQDNLLKLLDYIQKIADKYPQKATSWEFSF